MHHMNRQLSQDTDHHLIERQSRTTPLIITNKCADSIYPGLLTQSGDGPGIGGFELTTGSTRTLSVGEAWQGRVWGRTNCSFNSAGTGPAGRTSNGRACTTGDCGGVVDCKGTGEVPTTLAEWTLDTGNGQTFYDISLVDGYNLPLAIVLVAHGNTSLQSIPPHLTNPSCVATEGNLSPADFDPYENGDFLGCNASSPMPFDKKVTPNQAASWCPPDLEVDPQSRPQSGVYTYPDGSLQRPPFDPCYSACAKRNQPQDCCTGAYDSPGACSASAYSKAAKGVCPDAYSYAFDDQTSTFIIPAGAGFEVIFCPGGRSTNILATSKQELTQLAQQGHTKRSFGAVSPANLMLRGLDLTHLAAVGAGIEAFASPGGDGDTGMKLVEETEEGELVLSHTSEDEPKEMDELDGSGGALGPRANVIVTSSINISPTQETTSPSPWQTAVITTNEGSTYVASIGAARVGFILGLAFLIV